MSHGHFFSCRLVEPLVHPPEMSAAYIEPEFGHEPGDERELLRRPDRAAYADRVVVSALLPGGHIFECFREIEVFEGIVEDDTEAGAAEFLEIAWREARDFVDDIERQ